MSLLYIDGFDNYANSAGLSLFGWSGSGGGTVSFPSARTGNGFRVTGPYAQYKGGVGQTSYFTQRAAGGLKGGMGFAFRLNTDAVNVLAGRQVIAVVRPVSTGASYMLYHDTAGIGVAATRTPYNLGTLFSDNTGLSANYVPTSGSVSTPTWVNNWLYVEWVWDFSTSNNRVRFNGSNLDGINWTPASANYTQNSLGSSYLGSDNSYSACLGVAYFNLEGVNDKSVQHNFDDFYLIDQNGTYNNTFIGSCKVNTLAPTADDAVQMTPNTGTSNFSRVSEAFSDGDTSYVAANTYGQRDTYVYDKLVTNQVVRGVRVATVAKMAVGSGKIAPVIKMNGVGYVGTPQVVGSGYTGSTQIFEKRPDDATVWDKTAVNNAAFGLEFQA